MRQITLADIHVRLRGLQNSTESDKNRVLIESAQSVLKTNRVNDIKRFIEGSAKTNNQVPFFVYAELFDAVVENGTASDIRNIGSYIAENVVHKVRDSKATNTLLKGRLGRLKSKLMSPITKHFTDIMTNSLPSNIAPSNPAPTPSTEKEEAVNEAYNKMIEASVVMIHCDRVIENYNKVSKRFNLDKLFIENTRINGVEDSVVELCNMIDTYAMPTPIKFNTVIETAWYGFESNGIQYNKNTLLKSAVDYFMFKHDGLDSCRDILEATLFFDKNTDMEGIDIFTEEEPNEEETIAEAITNAYVKTEKPVVETTDFNKIFDNFKKEELGKDDKPQNKIKGLIDKLYKTDIHSVVDETPDLLKWFRRFFILGACGVPVIGPVLAGVMAIADKFISIYHDREEYPKMIKCFNSEIKASKTKLESIEDNEEKEKLKKYIESLEKARDKLNTAYNDLLTEEEQDARYDNMSDEEMDDILGSEFDFNLDDDDFMESTVLGQMHSNIENIVSITESNIINQTSMYRLMENVSDDDIIHIANLANKYPDTFYRESVLEGIKDTIRGINTGRVSCDSILTKSMKLSAFTSALSIMERYNVEENDSYGFTEAVTDIQVISEAYSAISIMIDTYNSRNTLLEASFTNTLKVASMKLRNATTKLKDKDRSISRSLDVFMNNFKKAIERALTNDNREAIIKGSILPSFSKIVKLCLVNIGLVALHQPLLAVITTLGYFAINGKFKAKERQMVIDEIEIEIKMCDKYIEIAESKNDMQALRQLLTTKRELERQRQRIKYKMRVEFGQKYYDASAPSE